jgi:hypothetical protein
MVDSLRAGSLETPSLSGLLQVAADEEAQRIQQASHAWLKQIFSADHSTATEWQKYTQHLKSILSKGTLPIREIRDLAAQAPASEDPTVQNLLNLFQERDPELLAESLLAFGEKNLNQEGHSRLARLCLQFAAQHPSTQPRAEASLKVLAGGGSFAEQLSYQAPRLLRELCSPLNLTYFAMAGIVARSASWAVLSRFGNFNLPAIIASESAAWLAEVPTLVAARRLGNQIFSGGEQLLSPSGMAHEILSSYGPFGLLRIGGHVFAEMAPTLGRLPILQTTALSTARLGMELSSVMVGHSLNAYLGLEPHGLSILDNFHQSLLTVAQIRLTGNLLDRIGLVPIAPSSFLRPPSSPVRRMTGSFLEHLQELMEPQRVVAEGLSPRKRSWDMPEKIFMAKNSDEGGSEGEGTGKGSPNPSSPQPTRFSVLKELLSTKIDDYTSEASNQDSRLGKAVMGLQKLLVRLGERPDLANDEAFAQALAEVRQALTDAQQSGTKIGTLVKTVKALVGNYTVSSEGAPDSERAKTLVESIDKDTEQRAEITENLSRLRRVLQVIGKKGLTKQTRSVLDSATSKLDNLFGGKINWSVPGFRRGANQSTQFQAQIQGALSGLAAKGWGTESPHAQELRGEGYGGVNSLELELDLLHYAALNSAKEQVNKGDLAQRLDDLARSFLASPESTSAMYLYSKAIQKLIYHKYSSKELFEYLKTHPRAELLQENFIFLSAMEDPKFTLSQLGNDSTAANYFLTGLSAFLDANGDSVRLSKLIQWAGTKDLPGFHPSIALSLFGAAYGREHLPSDLLPSEATLKRFLEMAQKND